MDEENELFPFVVLSLPDPQDGTECKDLDWEADDVMENFRG